VLEEGDLFDIPTGIFRGFENVGTDYGMIMAVLGGDDAGGGVIWAPQVLEEADAHGLVLSEQGRLYDTRRGQTLPEGQARMPPLGEAALRAFPELAVEAVVPRFVARYQDMLALSADRPAKVLGRDGLIRDRPGFEIELCGRGPIREAVAACWEVLMIHRGHWRLVQGTQEAVLAPGDTCAIPPDTARAWAPSMPGEASLFRIRPTDDPAGPTAW
jgi:hypothetical protein